MQSLEELKQSLFVNQTSFDSLTESYHEALTEIEQLEKELYQLEELYDYEKWGYIS